MLDRITCLSELYGKSVTELTKSRENWKGLLSGMARYYKYSFDNNVLIYVQKPNASQLATMEIWNKIGRRVKKVTKSIAVIDLSNPKASLKYLFDLMETNGSHESLRIVMGYMWELEEQYRPGIMAKFHDKYGADTESIESCIYSLVERRISEILPQYLQDFSVSDEVSMLYGLPTEAVKAQFSELVRDSVGYMVFKKCGLSTDMFKEASFEHISHFNSMELFMRMGSITMSIARPILREINLEIENIKYERSRQNEYEAIDRPHLQRGSGRDAVPQYPGVREQSLRPDGSGQIRETVERVHDGTAPAPAVRTNSGGQSEPDHNGSGRGSREPQGNTDTGASESAVHAGDGGHTGKGGAHGDDNRDSGRNNNERSGVENKINHTVSEASPPESAEPLSGGFLRQEDKNESISSSGKSASLSNPIYDRDELSDIVDLFLTANDTAPDCGDWQYEIHSFFTEAGHTLSQKANIVKTLYGDYDDSYRTNTGVDMTVKAISGGMDFDIEGQKIFLTYSQLAEKIDSLIMYGVYPLSSEEVLDGFAIPDEVHEMKGKNNEVLETATSMPAAETPSVTKEQIIEKVILQGNIRHGGKEGIQNAVLSMQAKKDRVSFIRSEYGYVGTATRLDGGGHYRWTADSKGIFIEYKDGSLEFTENLSWSRTETLISDLVQRGAYLLPGDIRDNPAHEHENPTDSDELQLGQYTAIKKEESAFTDESPVRQLSFFDITPRQDVYEITDGADSDGIITENTVPESKQEAKLMKDADMQDLLNHDDTFRYQLLDRLRIDCKYYLGYGNRYAKNLWAGNEEMQIEAMKTLWNSFTDENKPEWITLEEIEQYEKEMCRNYSHAIVNDFGLNYHYSPEHNLYEGGPKTKCRNNIEAIRLLKNLHAEGRPATAEEQIVLAKFIGWGGLANALTPGKSGWEKEYEEIRTLLTGDEFKSAQESTTTAYYTDHNVISHIYKALERFGFREGNIIDPAMGTGNFYSVLPERMAASKLYGVELDTITGGIAKQLFPDASIEVKGYEDINYPDHFFDVAIGNIPFNSIKVSDRRYDRHNFRVHDYFIAKTLDKVRSGGIIAFITSKYTLDKANPTTRKYIAQRAELIGAIRLPNNAFKSVAGTEATTDIIFLQKRDNEVVPDENDSPWISVEENEDGIPVNSYFIDHPEMVLGKMVFDESMFGNEKTTACHPREGDDLDKLLGTAVYYLDGQYREPSTDFESDSETIERESINADPGVKNYCYTMADGGLYYRENSRMYKQSITGRKRERIEGLIEVRSALRSLIEFQTNPYYGGDHLPTMDYETQLQGLIENLNEKYSSFVKKHGYINSLANVTAFSKDSDAPLLRSIEQENKDEKGVFEKTAVFYKATIKPKVMPKSADNAVEALKVSLNIKGRVDPDYMHWLYRRPDSTKPSIEEIIAELGDRIYQDPKRYTGDPHAGWVTAEEYLSGNVREKLGWALLKAEKHPELFTRNAEALRKVQPTPLMPQEISFTLGSTWIPVEIYQQFMYEKFQTNRYNRGINGIRVEYSAYSGVYHISGKGSEKKSVAANRTYGTERKNAYEILEDTLNLKPVTVKDPVPYVDPVTGEDRVKYVLNRVETVLAREKQAQIKLDFDNWLFSSPERSTDLTQLYNDRFNNMRPRQYDGSDLMLPDKSEIKLRQHQLDVIAHGIYGDGNLLIAHEVGAGKTMSGAAIAYELKRLGAFHKPLITAPNHLVGQWEKEFLRLYPNANILVAGKKDLDRKNRRRFVSRIATGDYDAVIMAHSSFELINLSREKQLSVLEKEINEITNAITMEKVRSGRNWSLKQMQIFKKNLQYRYDRLFKSEKKDDTINFEELGVDMLVVDEADVYKNNFSYSKLRNVAGISSQNSQRAMDMHMKCQHISDMNGGKGVVYLTGTPISNSMSELFVMQKTLQPKELQDRGLMMFDSWASTFGKIEASLEIRPEGNGYQMKNRFSRFHNLPELMSIFSMVADIKTAEMLPDLPVPKLATDGIQVIRTAITPDQKTIVDELVMRAEDIREKRVTSDEDNFLKLTNEARLLAVDPRILDPTLPDDPNTKLNECARNTAKIYHETADKKLTQLIFCDKGTPKDDGSFDFYNATKTALTEQGVKPEDIAFIHDAKTDLQREQLFDKVRRGDVRIMMGSTEKMGTGMNVQDWLFAVHHLDIPWRPRDLIQRNGRGLRQGNQNEEVHIFQYITEQTFDAYLFQILEQKQRYISQIMTGRSALRSCEDIDETVLQYAEFKALAVADERIKEKMEVDNEISRLQILKSSWKSQQGDLQYQIDNYYPREIKSTESMIEKNTADIDTYEKNRPVDFSMTVDGRVHDERVKAGEHLKVISRKLGLGSGDTLAVGSYAGFAVSLYSGQNWGVTICLNGKSSYSTDMGESELGNITRLENLADRIREDKANNERELQNLFAQLEQAKAEAKKPFANEERLSELLMRKVELDLALEFKEEPQNDALIDEDAETSGETASGQAAAPDASALGYRNYRKLYALAPEMLKGKCYYMKFKSEGFEDLVLENIGGGEISIAHYYEQNGDAMRDPEITMKVDNDNKTVTPTSFLQDNMGVYYTTDSVSAAKVRDLEQFMSQWFTNIHDQGFEAVEVRYYNEEEEEENEFEM